MFCLGGDPRGACPVWIGVLLGGQAEGVPAHRVQDVEPAHPLVAAEDVGGGVALGVADVQARAAGVGEHVEDVELGLAGTKSGVRKVLFSLPVGLPLRLDPLGMIRRHDGRSPSGPGRGVGAWRPTRDVRPTDKKARREFGGRSARRFRRPRMPRSRRRSATSDPSPARLARSADRPGCGRHSARNRVRIRPTRQNRVISTNRPVGTDRRRLEEKILTKFAGIRPVGQSACRLESKAGNCVLRLLGDFATSRSASRLLLRVTMPET